jgi:uncharacterized protein (TIGR02246 family)
MKFKYIAVALLALVAMSQPVLADQREDAYAALERWADAFNSGDFDKVAGMYTPDALLFATYSPNLASNPEDVRRAFKTAAVTKAKVALGEHSAVVLSNDAVVIAGFYDYLIPTDKGQPTVFKVRFSFVLVKRADQWQIANQHLSIRGNAD